MTAWKGWDAALLAYQGDPQTAENIAVLDAFQHVEGHGGDWNPFNVGPGPFHGVNLANAPYSGTPSPYPPTLDFPGASQGIAASEVVGESNWSSLLQALKTGHPLSYQWTIDQGAATPASQYTAEVRSLAQSYLSGAATYDVGDTALNKGGSAPGGGASSPGPGCATDNFDVGDCSGGAVPGTIKTGTPCCAHGYAGQKDIVGACNDDKCSQCCGMGIGGSAGGNQTPSGGGQSGCVCISIPSGIPIIGGDLKTCIVPQPACDFFGAITSQSFWVRAGEIILGLILVAIGLRMFVGGPSLSGLATKAATTAAVVA